MKLFFLKNDTLYKIFTTIEKTKKDSAVEIIIEEGNHFFANPRWSKQIDSILDKRGIRAVFIAQNDHQAHFFEENDINYELKKESKIRLFLNSLYWFFFDIKKFHIKSLKNNNYNIFIIFGVEILVVMALLYGLYSIVLPKTTITLVPSRNINEVVYNFRYISPDNIPDYPYKEKHIVIPLYTGLVQGVSSSINIDQNDIKGEHYLYGTIRLTNKLASPLTLVEGTQLIDEHDIEYTTDAVVYIPAAQSQDQAGVAYVKITSKVNPENTSRIEELEDGISSGETFLVKKLGSSVHTKQVYGTTTEDLVLAQYGDQGYIPREEVTGIQDTLQSHIEKKKKTYITSRDLPDESIFIPFDETTHTTNCRYISFGNTGDITKLQYLSGSMSCDIEFAYIYKQDIIDGVQEYIDKRASTSKTIIGIQDNTVSFFEILTGDYKSMIIPTRVNVIEAYNLEKDINHVLPEIKRQVAGKTKEEIQQLLQGTSELESRDIRITPFRYNSATDVTSRIHLKSSQK